MLEKPGNYIKIKRIVDFKAGIGLINYVVAERFNCLLMF